MRNRVSEAEWRTRVDLAACYRLVARHGWTDQIYNHVSARVPGPDEHFLINPYGLLYEEITASSLVKVDLDGTVRVDPTGLGINPAGFLIHSAVHRARRDVNCVIHTHSVGGQAVAAQRHGLLMISQHAMRFHRRLAYHDYEGLALDPAEQQRLVRDLGACGAMILRNHGLLTCAETIRQAFELMYYLERACAAQVATLAGGGPPLVPSEEVCERTARQFERPGRPAVERDWPALLRLLDRTDPDFRD
jgi:ribulose-5-phosphate 4-epimerase/fuculose-1-phosphate aldolase